MNRRRLLGISALAAAAALTAGRYGAKSAMAQQQQEPKKKNPGPQPDRGPQLEDSLVRSFVGAAHGDIDAVRTMLDAHPAIVNAVWDWGSGDFESALGGAAHMGRRDIALLLLERGARLDVFAAAMLGNIAVVQAAITAHPAAAKTPGPHGIPLLAHAKAGGEPAAAVVDYLKSISAG